MDLLIIGIIAYICFFVYDFNSVIWQNKTLHYSFLLGIVLIIISTASIIAKDAGNIQWDRISAVWGVIGATAFFSALIYTLFFALPFKTTYKDVKGARKLYVEGVYALCRHPGFWCLAGFYLSLYIIVPYRPIIMMAVLFNGLNFLYVVFQDYWTFPKTFLDYGRYVSSTPFLVPNFSSIKQCIQTIENRKGANSEFKK